MTLYLLVVGLILCGNTKFVTQWCALDYVRADAHAPRVDFFLSQDNAAREYAAAPQGSARLFKIEVDCNFRAQHNLSIKELNVLPAQSYEVSDKASVKAKP